MNPSVLAGIIGSGAAWAPALLFGGSDVGFALDFTDLSKLRQASNGTGAVAADTDPVGYVTDLSGKGNHAVQATSGNRPVWDATNEAVTFLSSLLQTPAINATGTDKMTVVICARVPGSGTARMLLESSANSNTNNGSLSISLGTTNLNDFSVRGNTAIAGLRAPVITAPFERVMSCRFDLAGALREDQIFPQINGTSPSLTGIGATSAGGGNFGNHVFSIGARSGLSVSFVGTIYRMIVIGRVLTDDEYAQAKNWCGEPIGFFQ